MLFRSLWPKLTPVYVFVNIIVDKMNCSMNELARANLYLIEATPTAMDVHLVVGNVEPLETQTGACIASAEPFKTPFCKVKTEGKLDENLG